MFLYRKNTVSGALATAFSTDVTVIHYIIHGRVCQPFFFKISIKFCRKPIFYRGFGMVRLIVPRIHDLSYNCCRRLRDPERVPDRAAAEQMAENKGRRKDDCDIAETGDHKGLDTHADSLQGTRRCYGDR